MNQIKDYFTAQHVQVIVEDAKCEFFIPFDFAIILNVGDVLFPYESGLSAKWVISSENIEVTDERCVIVKEKFFTRNTIMIFTILA